jgi:hypothetical protein
MDTYVHINIYVYTHRHIHVDIYTHTNKLIKIRNNTINISDTDILTRQSLTYQRCKILYLFSRLQCLG